ncbi:hypothetical protein IWT140_01691 [Secundilactobacillus pentosiphilus]|uniref:Uncharacterized protein n=1 Tax=Secundilactobacillus pentosiphilus TaxID=1714682 RepID=A0A1Z5IQK6_9LACO|nr:hypothetical protein [Secundilactobacillus pentosiphilus]GAX04054.1 hypothetical protein IWT140_01691 [Secundilactobacillus pentosiphilus]
MNSVFNHFLQYVIPLLIGGAGTWWATTVNDKTKREDVYADHMPEWWDRLDKITQERDDLKEQVNTLQIEVEKQSATIKQQSKIIDQLNESVNELKISINKTNKEIDEDVKKGL